MAELEKAFLKFEGSKDTLPCMFNPESISLKKTNMWAGQAMPGRSAPKQKFGGQEPGTLTFGLTFDTTSEGVAVTKYTNQLLAKMEIDKNLPGTNEKSSNARPPTVTFHWGQLASFPAVITSADVSFTYFSSTGMPLRATVTLALTQYAPSRAFTRQNPTSGTPEPHRVHRVQPGETLDRISARYYGDSTRWRMLAAANGIEDPLSIRPGSLLSVPLLGSG